MVTGKVNSKAEADDILRMASVYSKDVVNSLSIEAPREKQIMLKVQFAEVDRTKLEQFGFNILSTGAANTPGRIVDRPVRGAIGLTEILPIASVHRHRVSIPAFRSLTC